MTISVTFTFFLKFFLKYSLKLMLAKFLENTDLRKWMFAKGKISEKINELRVTKFKESKNKILKQTFNLKFST